MKIVLFAVQRQIDGKLVGVYNNFDTASKIAKAHYTVEQEPYKVSTVEQDRIDWDIINQAVSKKVFESLNKS